MTHFTHAAISRQLSRLLVHDSSPNVLILQPLNKSTASFPHPLLFSFSIFSLSHEKAKGSICNDVSAG